MHCAFYNVDTQIDFMEPYGALYVVGSEKIKTTLLKLTQLAKEKNITVVNTCDFHDEDAAEFSNTPDFIHTFPRHCVQGEHGFEYIEETTPELPFVVYKEQEEVSGLELNCRNIILRKNQFDVFNGNYMAKKIVDSLPYNAVVYGVATNYCVDYVVQGLLRLKKKVYVVKDAVKEINGPKEPQTTFAKWKSQGVEILTFQQLCGKILKIGG